MSEPRTNGSDITISRREFLSLAIKGPIALTLSTIIPEGVLAYQYLEPLSLEGFNPLETYPYGTKWEDVYRKIYEPDETFTFTCIPNCTFVCLLKASVKNGIVTYVDPSYGFGEASDVYGNKVSHRWDPMTCPSGVAIARRAYSNRRVKGVYVREGFLKWVEDGFPRDPKTGLPPSKYFEGRGKEKFVKVSWDRAFDIVSRALINIVEAYSGENAKRLLEQGYHPAMVEAMGGAGVRTIKIRPSMPLNAPMRLTALWRFANMLALLDSKIRGVDPDKALGAKVWDNYAWHTDLAPGQPMAAGIKAIDFHLHIIEHVKLALVWGMNWTMNKMAVAKWLSEAHMKGVEVIAISNDHMLTARQADELIIVRSGTDTALALSLVHVIIRDKLYDEAFIKRFTDLPLLVRMDNLKFLRARDLIKDYKPVELKNRTKVLAPGETAPPPALQGVQFWPKALRDEIDDSIVWDLKTNSPRIVSRDDVGKYFEELGVDPALEGEFEVTLVDGTRVKVRPVFDLIKEYVMNSMDPKTVSEITGVEVETIERLARKIAANKGKTLFVLGMGINQFLHGDLKDRATILLAALTANIGNISGTLGTYAGNFKLELANGVVQWINEDPFNPELDPTKPARIRGYFAAESAHYYAYGDRPLVVAGRVFTGKTHMPTPTKAIFFANANSSLGNAKWAYNIIVNVLPKVEMIVTLEWFWTLTCEYSDIVFGVDSWIERKIPDIAVSVTTPFITAWPRSPLPRMFDTRDDMEVVAGIAARMAELLNEPRMRDYWKFVYENKVEVYVNRVLAAGNTTKGLTFEILEEQAKKGIPFVYATRTTPSAVGWEQTNESVPWWTKTGRLEFYKEEGAFIESGENIPVYREPADSTHYEPNVIILNKPHSAIRPLKPEDMGLDPANLDQEVRQVRHVAKPWSVVKTTSHPLKAKGYTHIITTPKHKGLIHTICSNVDILAIHYTPYGDMYRRDKRMPWVAEGYVDINPEDGRKLGLDDGDYVRVEGDPNYEPFIGLDKKPEERKAFTLVARIRFNNSIPPGMTRVWFNFYMASHGTVEGHEKRPDKLALNERTGYIASYRYGGHQSVVRTWLKPTLMTDDLFRKSPLVAVMGKGFAPDIHSPIGAPREGFAKITKLEPGGEDGKSPWRPVRLKIRPTYEDEEMKTYIRGGYVIVEG